MNLVELEPHGSFPSPYTARADALFGVEALVLTSQFQFLPGLLVAQGRGCQEQGGGRGVGTSQQVSEPR